MIDNDSWRERRSVIAHLGEQLYSGRLSVVLGAGASIGFGLPGWSALVNRMFEHVSTPRPAAMSDELASELLWRAHYGENEATFAEGVRKALYEGVSADFSELAQSRLLAAVSALVMASQRGNAAFVCTFNFDDLLERYLRYYGLDVESVAELPAWKSRRDVSVLHPHGLLPLDPKVPVSPIVFVQRHYDKIVGNVADLWRQSLTLALRSTTPLFIGLSGADDNLRSMLSSVHELHSSRGSAAYWGVRFSTRPDDELRVMWEGRGVYHQTVADYETDLPNYLLEVCQAAMVLRERDHLRGSLLA